MTGEPHVDVLIYDIEHCDSVAYTKATPLEVTRSRFCIRIENLVARIKMIDHFESPEEARETVEPFLMAWEMDASLRFGPRAIEFTYNTAEVIDISSGPGQTLYPQAGKIGIRGMPVSIVQDYIRYPEPPTIPLGCTANVSSIFDRYLRYCEGREPLPSMAYFCLTVLEGMAIPAGEERKRQAASRVYSIEYCVLKNLGELTALRGGDDARKADGLNAPLTQAETEWIKEAVKKLIRRFAEYVANPDGPHKKISMSDLL